jgi:hypothetical protein
VLKKMPSLDAFTLTGRSSKCSSLGSDGRTRTGRAILALRLLRFTGYSVGEGSGMMAFEMFLLHAYYSQMQLHRQPGALNLIVHGKYHFGTYRTERS